MEKSPRTSSPNKNSLLGGVLIKKNLKCCWVITDGSAGMENQAWGLSESLGYQTLIKRVHIRQPWLFFSPYLQYNLKYCLAKKSAPITPPWPDLVIACGRRSILPSLYIKKASQGQTPIIYLQNPKISPKKFDIIVCPAHDKLQGPNVIHTIGAPHRVTEEKLLAHHKKFKDIFSKYPGPRYSILIGGPNKVYHFSKKLAYKIAQDLKSLQKKDKASLLITFSRRTPAACIEIFHSVFKETPRVYMWNFTGENPYFALLSWGDAIILTCDSISMISEACFTTKPVYLISLPGSAGKFNLFYKELLKIDRISWFNGQINTDVRKPFKEATSIKNNVQKMLETVLENPISYKDTS